MSSTLNDNAFHILSLDVTSRQADVIERSRDIIRRLQANDFTPYDKDLGSFACFRTEESVNDAVQKLLNSETKLKEFFFWFHIFNPIDQSAYKAIKVNEILSAVDQWLSAIKTNDAFKHFYMKNLALLYCLSAAREVSNEYITNSLLLWKGVIESQEFWKMFFDTYRSHDPSITDEILEQFKLRIQDYLFEIYSDIQTAQPTSSAIKEFKNFFQSNQLNNLDSLHETLCGLIQELEITSFKTGEVIDSKKLEMVHSLAESIKNEFDHLVEQKLFDDDDSRMIRDRATKVFISIANDLYKSFGETTFSNLLLTIADKVVSSNDLKKEIQGHLEVINVFKKNEAIVRPLNELMLDGKFSQALKLINKNQDGAKGSNAMQAYYQVKKKECVSTLAIQKWGQGHEYLDKDIYKIAKRFFREAHNLIYNNIDLFNFNKDVIDSIIDDIKYQSSKLNRDNLANLESYRYSIVKIARDRFNDIYEDKMFMVLIDTYFYIVVINYINRKEWVGTIIQVAICIVLVSVIAFFVINSTRN